MYSLTILIAAAAIALVVGLAIGIMTGRHSSPAGQKQREVERRLDQVLQDKKAYEDDVVEHFSDTARLLNTLTDSYREVHNHLASGASSLCQDTGPVGLDSLENPKATAGIPADIAEVQPPLDYAPKTSPDQKGVLNEEFGIERTASGDVTQAPAKA